MCGSVTKPCKCFKCYLLRQEFSCKTVRPKIENTECVQLILEYSNSKYRRYFIKSSILQALQFNEYCIKFNKIKHCQHLICLINSLFLMDVEHFKYLSNYRQNGEIGKICSFNILWKFDNYEIIDNFSKLFISAVKEHSLTPIQNEFRKF